MRPAVIAAAVVLWLTALPGGAQTGSFIDDDGRPSEQALEWLAERDVIHGCDPPDNHRVCPHRPLSRVQAAKILVRLARVEGAMAAERPGSVDHFSDDDTVWQGSAEPFIDHLADLRIIHGCDPPHNRSFCPQETLRRGEITKMVIRTFGLEAPSAYTTPWSDTEGQFFHEAARVGAYHGLFDSSAGIFEGYGTVSRGEFARIVVALFEPDLCDDDPFSQARVRDLEADHPGVRFAAYAYDLDTECGYSMNPTARQQTASVFKIMVMGGTFLEAQADGRSLTSAERSWLESMMTESADPPVRDLWGSFGGAPWFTRQAEILGLDETDVVGDYSPGWGRTTTSAYDQGRLLGQVLLGEGGLIEPASRREARDLMTAVISSQTWGVTEGVPEGWTVAQKNGFAAGTTNSVGLVYDEEMHADYVVVVLSQGWPIWERGVPAVERIGSWVSSALAN